jgi:hypothetical protein
MGLSESPQHDEAPEMTAEEKDQRIMEDIARIDEALEELEREGSPDFAHAWERVIYRGIEDIRQIGKEKEDLLAVLNNPEHIESQKLWNILNQRVNEDYMVESVIKPEWIKQAVEGLRALVKDLRKVMQG